MAKAGAALLKSLGWAVLSAVPTDQELLARFRAGDEAAFTLLVRRHADLVFGVCRRALPNEQDAEDVCQATFLVLARKAGSVRWQASIANWLHTTARRLAWRANRAARRRALHESRWHGPPSTSVLDQLTGREALAILDDELERLSPRYREPLVLCHLQGLTRDEAAARLGVPLNTLKSRLDRGRKRLAEALARRGVGAGVGLLALAVASPAGAAPSRLVEAILAAVAGAPSPTVAALARGVAMSALLNRSILALILLASLTALGMRLAATPPAAEPPPQAKPAEPTGTTFTYAGRVFGADGMPASGAKVYLCGLKPGVIEFTPRTRTGPDGSFRFTVRRDEFRDRGVVPAHRSPPEKFVTIGVTAVGHAGVAHGARLPEERERLVFHLPREEVVTGRVVDLEGRPIAGIKLYASIHYFRQDKDRKPLPFDAADEAGQFSGNVAPTDPDDQPAVTGSDGRFTLRGLARDWLYELYVMGPTIVSTKARLLPRPLPPTLIPGTGISTPEKGDPKLLQYGSSFTHVATPSKLIRGTVREKGTGRPIADMQVEKPWTRDDEPSAWTKTDRDGRYELTGLPRGVHAVTLRAPANSPYLDTEVIVRADQPGTEPVTHNVEMVRQAAVTGVVTDRTTGRPVSGWVEYRPLARNTALRERPLLTQPRWRQRPPSAALDAAGRFVLPVLPGPGVLLVQAEGDHLPARIAKEDRLAGDVLADDPEVFDCRPLPAWPGEYHAYRLLDGIAEKDLQVALSVDPGRRRPLVREFPDGKPRAMTVLGLRPPSFESSGESVAAEAPVEVRGLTEGERRRLFLTTSDGLATVVTVDGGEAGPVTVRLRPTGGLSGRLVNLRGEPLPGVSLQVVGDAGPGQGSVVLLAGGLRRLPDAAARARSQRTTGVFGDKGDTLTGPETTDADGRFRLTGLPAGVSLEVRALLLSRPDAKGRRTIRGLAPMAKATAESGRTVDLGERKVDETAARLP